MPVRYNFAKMYWSENKQLKWPEDYETFFGAFNLPHNTLTHVGHCTDNHCKYGDEDCPVATGKVLPVFRHDDDWELELIPGRGRTQ